jgi:hypothetical protein
VLEGGEVGLAFDACNLTIFQHEPQYLRHAWFWWRGRISSGLTTSSHSHSRDKGLVRIDDK